jgi:hypothetical protein
LAGREGVMRPPDDAWRRVTLALQIKNDRKLYVGCHCGHEVHSIDAAEFAAKHKIDIETPLRLIAPMLKCSKCGRRGAVDFRLDSWRGAAVLMGKP